MNSLIHFQFKGERTYVQGGDFYDKVSDLLAPFEYINEILFRHMTNKNCLLKNEASQNDIVAAVVKTNKHSYVLVETNSSVNERNSYDEDLLIKEATVTGNKVSMSMHGNFTLIENIIAMTKKLNYSVNPDVDGKWLFGQLKLDQPFPSNVSNITIESTRRIPNRFSENAITIDESYYGKIIFIVGKP